MLLHRFPDLRLPTVGFPFVLLALALVSCQKPAAVVVSDRLPDPKVEGDKVTFPPNSPQRNALSTETVQPIKALVVANNGRLGWYEDATVRVFAALAGRVAQIHAQIGQEVKEGDTLASIVSPDFGQAQADASKAQADLHLAEKVYARLKDLFENGAAAKKDVEAAEDDLATKRSENQRAQARLRLYGSTSGNIDGLYTLKTPVSGTIVDKTINPGQEVRPDQMLANAPNLCAPLFIVSDPSKLSIQLDVTELEMSALKVGQKLKIRSRAYPDRVFEGRIELIGDTLDALTRTLKVRGIVDNHERLLKAEMYVSVDVEDATPSPSKPAPSGAALSGPLEISANAVFSLDQQQFVFVENADGQYQRRAIHVALEHHGKAIVSEGLASGERIVSSGCLLLQSLTDSKKE